MNPVDRWNPGWQFLENAQRAQAGGNRPPQAPAVIQPPAPGQFAGRHDFDRNNRQQARRVMQFQVPNRRVQRQHQVVQNQQRPRNQQLREERAPISRDEHERIDTMARKDFHTRTALEYDKKENQCWWNILNELNSNARQFTPPKLTDGPEFIVPSDEKILNSLRSENQYDTIMNTRDLLCNLGATERELNRAIEKLRIHLRTNESEFHQIQVITDDLIVDTEQLTTGIDELEAILLQIEKCGLQ